MKIRFHRVLLLLSTTLLMNTTQALSLPSSRATFWGFGGSDVLARADIMAGLFGNETQMLWTDIQGKYGEEGTWMGALGAGYRRVNQNARILGIYGFMDYNVSPRGNSFWVASPGIESLGNLWDFRLNGYFPVSSYAKKIDGIVGDSLGVNRFVFFTEHQQFDRLFNLVEQVGNGVDGEIGRTFACLHQTRAYIGGYYFNVDDRNSDTTFSHARVGGVSGRLEFPIRPHIVLQAIDTYDNVVHNTALIGLQYSFGNDSHRFCQTQIKDRMWDPVSRNLATQSIGSGIPVVEGYKDQGKNVLVRKNIYFFTDSDGSTFDTSKGVANGTFEHPLAGTSFNQTTINDINAWTSNANFYFKPGTYQFDPLDANSRISLHTGQSMWGRSNDYTLAAKGNERALFLGGIDLGVHFAAGNNRLDSIRLLNSKLLLSFTRRMDLRVLELKNASDVVLFNDSIAGSVTNPTSILSGFPGWNLISGIYANDSQVVMKDSNIDVEAIIVQDNLGLNFATGIGGNAADVDAVFMNNVFTIINSSISSTAHVGRHNAPYGNLVENYATGIGGNAARGPTGDGDGNFINNKFTIKNSKIMSFAKVDGDNFFSNYATGIGGNNNEGVDADFIGNTFILLNDDIDASAILFGDNLQANFFPGSGQNAATGIGGNSILNYSADFVDNNFTINNSRIAATALVDGGNLVVASVNFATGIGGNASSDVKPATAKFIRNDFTIDNSTVSGIATVLGENLAFNFGTGIGGNSTMYADPGVAAFIDNNFNITNLTLIAHALVEGSNVTGLNQATGIDFDGGSNIGDIDKGMLDILARAIGPNNARGVFATGLGDVINLKNSTLSVVAVPSGTTTCSMGNVNFINTLCIP